MSVDVMKKYDVLSVEVENFCKIRYALLDLATGKPVTFVGGDNGAGKSSLLNAIPAALGGGHNTPSQPVRKGAKKAKITVDLGEIRVILGLTATGTRTLEVYEGNKRIANPQAALNAIYNKIGFDPLAFCNLPGKERVATLLKVVELDTPYEEMEAAIKAKEAALTEARRERDRTRKVLESTPKPENAPEVEPDETGLMQQYLQLKSQEDRALAIDGEIAAANRAIAESNRKIENLREKIAAVKLEISVCENQIGDSLGTIEKLKAEAAALNVPVLQKKVDEVKSSVDSIKTQRQAWFQAQQYKAKHAEYRAALRTFDLAEGARDEALEARSLVLAKAKLPYPGLTWADDDIQLNGVLFEQAAQSQKLLVSMSIAFALNPQLNLVIVRDASLFDAKSLELMAKLAAEKGARVLAEVVGQKGDIIIDDGVVKGQDALPLEADET